MEKNNFSKYFDKIVFLNRSFCPPPFSGWNNTYNANSQYTHKKKHILETFLTSNLQHINMV